MPELPEVETIVNDLQRKIVDKKIARVEVRLKKIVKSPIRAFVDTVEGGKFVMVQRRGKLLIFHLDKKGQYMLVHLRMTGQLIYRSKGAVIAGGHSTGNDLKELSNKYSHVIFTFSDQTQLFF